jgi:uncharacterized membrane protein
MRAMFVAVNCLDRSIAEDRKNRTDRNRDQGHRHHVDPDRNAKRRGRGSCNRAAEPRNNPHREQKHRRPDLEALYPRRQACERGFQIEQMARVAIYPVADERRDDDADGVDDRSPERPENRTVHNGQGISDRKRRGCNHSKDCGRDRDGDNRPNESDKMFDVRLVTNDQRRQREGSRQQADAGTSAQQGAGRLVGYRQWVVEEDGMLLIRLVITLLCAVGFYASVFMLRKSILSERGLLAEPSVVQSSRAKLFGGLPNSAVGLVYYAALAGVSWFARGKAFAAIGLTAAILAAVVSLFLAYSLIFVTKRSCPYCFMAHAVNLALVIATTWLLVLT